MEASISLPAPFLCPINGLSNLGRAYLLNANGQIDCQVLSRTLEKYFHKNHAKLYFFDLFGKSEWEVADLTTEISREEFLAIYKYGTFEYVVDWLPRVYMVTGKLIKREELFRWILLS
jgi:hypothetical protein